MLKKIFKQEILNQLELDAKDAPTLVLKVTKKGEINFTCDIPVSLDSSIFQWRPRFIRFVSDNDIAFTLKIPLTEVNKNLILKKKSLNVKLKDFIKK